ncbi:MFS transporter [Pasteuria penetrans]|uniref:MFS transporter n=1 Tax=Pasteuria penetrans TaxID=86005 RepID=UPI000FB3A468|nr:MFS transporter [Pasteuria penetrans]
MALDHAIVARGGWRRMMYVLMALVCIVYASMMMIYPFLPLYLQTMGVTGTERLSVWVGVIEAAPFFSMFLVSPIWGRFADRLGHKWMIVRAAVCATVVTLLMAWARSPWELLVLRLIEGAFCNFFPAAIAMASSLVPSSRLQYASSMLQTGFMVGLTAGPLLGGWLVDVFQDRDAFAKYQYTFWVAAIILAVITLVAAFVLRGPKGRIKTETGIREGLFTQGLRFLRHRPLGQLLVISFSVAVANFSYIGFLSILLQEFTTSERETIFWVGILWSAIAIATAIASPFVGMMGGRWGSYRVLRICLMGAALSLMTYGIASSKEMLAMISLPLGAFTAGIYPSIYTLLARAAPSSAEMGAVYGFQSSFSSLGYFVGPVLLSGVVAMVSGAKGLRGVFIVAGLLALGIFLYIVRSRSFTVAYKEEG